MSETVPRSNPRLENFKANEAAYNQKQFENELYGEAGESDFSDEALARIEEADAYERHLEAMAQKPNYDPNSAEGARARRTEFIEQLDDLNSQPDYTAERNEAKIASDPKLGRMNILAQEIAALREKKVTAESGDSDADRLVALEDKLNDLLADYEGSEDYDSEIADELMNRTDKTTSNYNTGTGDNSKASESEPASRGEGDDVPLDPTPSEGENEPDGEEPLDPLMEGGEKENEEPKDPLASDDEEPRDPLTDGEEPQDPIVNNEPGSTTGEAPAPQEEKKSRLKQAFARVGKKFERFKGAPKSAYIVLGAVAVAGAIAAYMGLDSDESVQAAAGQVVEGGYFSGGGGHVAPTLESASVFTEAAHTVTEGEGWLSTLRQMGLSPEQSQEILPKLLNSTDPSIKEWVYQMKDGNPGISHTGQIPTSVLESIKNLR